MAEVLAPPRQLAFTWTPEWQAVRVCSETYVHRGRTNTSPSHDVAHLLVGACSELPWNPDPERKTDRLVRLAEFNAITLEHLVDSAAKAQDNDQDFERVMLHAKDFVESYYAPFPVPYVEALGEFIEGMDFDAALRLAPVILHQRLYELVCPEFLELSHAGAFVSDAEPEAAPSARRGLVVLAHHFERLLGL